MMFCTVSKKSGSACAQHFKQVIWRSRVVIDGDRRQGKTNWEAFEGNLGVRYELCAIVYKILRNLRVNVDAVGIVRIEDH